MPIYCDPDELQARVMMDYAASDISPLPDLEALSGADYFVTPSNLPCKNETTLRLHLSKFRAVLVQRKSGQDWPASVGVRLAESINRMRAIAPRPAQRLLVITGIFAGHPESGEALMGEPRVSNKGEPYVRLYPQTNIKVLQKSLYTAQMEWQMRGGSFVSLACEADFLPFLRRLEELLNAPRTKQMYDSSPVYEESDDMLQSVEVVRDARLTLCSLPHIGPKLARLCLEQWGNVRNSIMWLSAPRLFASMPDSYPRGIGEKIVGDIHEWLGGEMCIYADTEETF